MKKFLFLTLSIFMLGNFTVKSDVVNFDLLPTAYAQEAEAGDSEVKEVEVEDRDVTIQVANDIEDSKLDIPAWLGSVIMFGEGIPTVGPVITKALGYMGLAAAILTFLASLLMGLSGILVMLGANKNGSPSWLKQAKKYVDYGVEIAKYLSMFNKQKK